MTEHAAPDQRSPGAMSTYAQRTRILMQLYRVTISPWVRRALANQLPPAAYGGIARRSGSEAAR